MVEHKPTQDLSGKNIVITGGNRGIGRSTSDALAAAGANITLICRNQHAAEQAVQAIRDVSGNPNVGYELADLSNQSSIHEVARKLDENLDRIDVLINNAAVFTSDCKLSPDGFEMQFAVNHLAYFLLTQLLLDKIKGSAPSRIINVSSEGHRYATIDWGNLKGEKNYSGLKAYGYTKLMNLLFTYKLAKLLEESNVSVNALHPGGVATNLGTGKGGFASFLWDALKPFMIKPHQGAKTSVFLAASPAGHKFTGQYFINQKPARSKANSYDEQLQDKLWELSCSYTGIQVSTV